MEHFPRYWPFVRRIHKSPVNPRTKASNAELLFSLICAWINGWVNTREAGDLRRYRVHYDVTVMFLSIDFAQMIQHYFNDIGTILWLLQCQLNHHELVTQPLHIKAEQSRVPILWDIV